MGVLEKTRVFQLQLQPRIVAHRGDTGANMAKVKVHVVLPDGENGVGNGREERRRMTWESITPFPNLIPRQYCNDGAHGFDRRGSHTGDRLIGQRMAREAEVPWAEKSHG